MPTQLMDQQSQIDKKILATLPFIGACLSIAGVLVVAVLILQRLKLGVDFTDESFYVALQYRFALGDIPLQDEQNLSQFAAILVLPLTRLFLNLQGHADGLVLLLRQVHFVFTAVIALVVLAATQKTVGWKAAMLTSTICLVFVPFNIHSPSYNTLGSGFLTIGSFLGFYAIQRIKVSCTLYLLSGFAHALAILAYPTLFIPVGLFASLVFFYREGAPSSKSRLAYLCGGLLGASIPVVMVLKVGLTSLSAFSAYFASNTPAGMPSGLDKFWHVIFTFWSHVPNFPWLVVGISLMGLWHWRRPSGMKFILPFLPLLLVRYAFGANGTDNLYFVTAVAILGPLVYQFMTYDKFSKHLFIFVWLPSFFAGVTTAWSSTNGAMNAAIGMFPATLATVLLIIRALQLMPLCDRWMHAIKSIMTLVSPVLVILPLLIGGYADVYGDPAPSQIGHREIVTSGPFRGIGTTPNKNIFIQNLSRDLSMLVKPGDTVLFFNDFPAGYLFTNARPATNSIWLPSGMNRLKVDRTPTLRYYETNGLKPSLVFLLRKSDTPNDALVMMIKGPEYREVFKDQFFTAYRRQTLVNP